jgi:hypothetical protein
MCAMQMLPGALALKHTPEEKYPASEWQRHDLNCWQVRKQLCKYNLLTTHYLHRLSDTRQPENLLEGHLYQTSPNRS